MYVSIDHCGQSEQVQVANAHTRRGPLRCKQCDALISGIDVSGAQSWIDSQVARKRELTQTGQLGTRKQSAHQSDEQIDRDGLSAELAACAILCPHSLEVWRRAAHKSRGNHGRDLLRYWTGLNQPVEVKHTRYQDAKRGFLLVRPPRQTPGRMGEEYIDDAIYVLMVGEPFQHQFVGWTNREGLVREGQLNPVPMQPGQRESWGMHWSQLRPLDELAGDMGRGGMLRAIARRVADFGGA